MRSAEISAPRTSEINPPPGHPCLRVRRPRAEDCDTLRASGLRPLVEPGAASYRLVDGTVLELLWHPTVGGFGDGGVELGVACPRCSSRARVLRRPPSGSWGCWQCQPVSMPSHRRSGNSRGKAKPATWALERIRDEQARCVALLGLAQWPPPPLFWGLRDLEAVPRRPDAPRLSRHRRDALVLRLDALESLRIAALLPMVRREIKALGGEADPLPPLSWAIRAERVLVSTTWAMRRQARDPRSLRQLEALRPEPFDRGMAHRQ